MAATQRKPASSTKKAQSRKPSTSRSTSASSGRKKGNTRKNSSHQSNNYGLGRYKDEITIVVTLVIAVILILSNFNLSGSVGAFINKFTFGMIGFLAYILPYLLFFGIAFYISNKGNYAATIKLVSSICLICMVAAFIQLVTVSYNAEWKVFDYYTGSAANKNGGGLIGGIIYYVMYPLFGFAGTLVIMLAIMTLLAMFITERLLFASLGKRSAEKLKEMKVRREEAKRAREETYYSEEYDEDYEDEEVYEEPERKPIRQSSRQAEQDVPQNARKSVKGERKKKAKTFTFPEVGHNKAEAHVQNQGDAVEDNVPEVVQTTPLEEIKPFDFDSIPIYRGDKTSDASYDDKPVYKEEMKRKFSQNKDYDIKKLAQQIMNESFDGSSTGVDATKVQHTTEVEEENNVVKAQVIDTGIDSAADNNYSDSYLKEDVEATEQQQSYNEIGFDTTETDLDDDFKDDLSELNFGGKDVAFENQFEEQQYESSDFESQQFDSQQFDSSEDDFEDFRVDLKALENEEVEEAFFSSNYQEETIKQEKTVDTTIVEPIIEIIEEPIIYEFPPIELLSKPKQVSKGASDSELKETAMKLQQTLQSFGVGVTITNVSCGPAVTRYELQPEQGVKVSKITNLADDIKLNLAAADIRIEAPIPGKAAVGIEVPNKENSAVMFRELIEGKSFTEHGSSLAFAVGKDIGGQVVVTDIAKMPHLLIAGATGSGKSVCINTIVMSILYKAHPDDVKLIMVDPKVVELSVYNGIPHLLIPVVTDPKKASAALNWAVMEMTDRYNRFAELGVRDIKGYNTKIEKVKDFNDEKFQKMPQIVIIVDELADLMMVAPGEVEDAICRLAQMARAAGIHLIIATQRP
ncbi:FtsK/SpoIIIE family DNA translocase, partial [Anaerosporobacter sp.]|uniref:FtsK/SpoIIIE family DNA translocase n=1 Tax=Anaerosporobacter sp. TaxID=1872529 RepID=UPI00286F7096